MINGRTFDWESIRIDTIWGIDLEIQSISYSTEAPTEAVYGRGNSPRAYGRGNLSQDGSMELNHRSFLQLTLFAGTQGGLFNIPPFDVNVAYANSDQIPQDDILPQVKINSTETEATQGDTEIKIHSIDFIILNPIRLNGIAVL